MQSLDSSTQFGLNGRTHFKYSVDNRTCGKGPNSQSGSAPAAVSSRDPNLVSANQAKQAAAKAEALRKQDAKIRAQRALEAQQRAEEKDSQNFLLLAKFFDCFN